MNAQSLRNKRTEFVDFVLTHKLDLVAICETWFKDGDNVVIKDITPAGCELKQVPRPKPKRGGGVALLYKSGFTVRFPVIAIEPTSFEFLSTELISSNQSLSLTILYRPQQKSTGCTFTAFLEEFSLLVESAVINPMPLIIAGDFNVHVDNANDRDANTFKELLYGSGLQQHVDTATHKKGHTLDLFITRLADLHTPMWSDLNIIDGTSSHFAITARLHLKRPSNTKKAIPSRNICNIQLANFCDDIEPLNDIVNAGKNHKSSAQVEQYNGILSRALDKHAPVKQRSITLHHNSPWCTDAVRAAKKKRRQIENKWRRTHLEIDRQLYCEQKKLVIHLTERAKSNYYNELFADHRKDQKQIYRLTDKLLHKNKSSPVPFARVQYNLAHEFCTFFTDKIKRIRDGQETVHTCEPHGSDGHASSKLNAFDDVTVKNVHATLTKSPPKSCNLDPIPAKLLKQCEIAILPAKTTIINTSHRSGQVPPSLKVAQIQPTLKKATLDPNEMSNYRAALG
ncbi:uncharacterized protein [Asterias amurensis]|uniref:uncharacterized protein n=1 Tax=Asterias amurensis TaxID=7602 RepID=UPI003AB671E8